MKTIRDLRSAKGMSLRIMAKELNCSASYLNDVEKGNRKLTTTMLNHIVDKFSADLNTSDVKDFIVQIYSSDVINRYIGKCDTSVFGDVGNQEFIKKKLTLDFYFIMTGKEIKL